MIWYVSSKSFAVYFECKDESKTCQSPKNLLLLRLGDAFLNQCCSHIHNGLLWVMQLSEAKNLESLHEKLVIGKNVQLQWMCCLRELQSRTKSSTHVKRAAPASQGELIADDEDIAYCLTKPQLCACDLMPRLQSVGRKAYCCVVNDLLVIAALTILNLEVWEPLLQGICEEFGGVQVCLGDDESLSSHVRVLQNQVSVRAIQRPQSTGEFSWYMACV